MTASTSPVALVTGARTGIGRSLAEHLVRHGYRVVGCSRTPADWEAEHFTFIQADVTDEQQVLALFRDIRLKFDRLDALLNNAGAASMNHVLLTPVSTLKRLVDANLVGTWLVSREAAKIMKAQKSGRIVNFSSIAVPLHLPGHAAYVAAKGAVEHLSQVMARELAEFGITVNVVGPTPITTDMTEKIPSESMDKLVASFPIQRLGTMEDVANVVDFFLRPQSSAVTAQVIYLGGIPHRSLP